MAGLLRLEMTVMKPSRIFLLPLASAKIMKRCARRPGAADLHLARGFQGLSVSRAPWPDGSGLAALIRISIVLTAIFCIASCSGCAEQRAKDVTGLKLRATAETGALDTQASAAQEFAAGLLNRDAVIEASQSVTRERYPNADDVLVDDFILNRYEPDGTAVEADDTFVKVLTEKGKRENKTLSFHFTLPYETVSVALLEVIRPDGTVTPVDVAEQSRVMVDPSQMSSNIYNPNRKILRVGVPGLELNDMVRYVSVRNLVKPRVPNTWSDYVVLEYTSPIRHFVYEVHAPKELPLRRIALKAEVPGTITHQTDENDERLIYRWEARDVPRMYAESSMPPLHTVVQRLLVSTIPDWEAISNWYSDLCEPHLKTTPEMQEKVEELTSGLTGGQEQIEAIFKFVSQEVRYMGITTEKAAPGYEPHDVGVTFEKRYGVCRDKAALLVAMLRHAGFEAYAVLIHNGPKKDVEVPQPYFNHAISAVRREDGTYQLMDATDESTKDLFPAYLCNKSYLVATPEGRPLLTSAIVPAEDNLVLIETRASLNDQGDLEAESTLRFEGINDSAYRNYFSRIKPDERRRFFEALAKRVMAGAQLVDLDIQPDDIRDTSRPLSVRLTFEAKDILVAGPDAVMLPVMRWGTRVGMVNFILRGTGLEKRKYPLRTELACGVRETFTLVLGRALGRSLSMPEYEPIEDETLAWRRELAQLENVITGSSEFMLKTVEFGPSQYLALKETLKKIEYENRKMPIFAPAAAAVEPDADDAVSADIVIMDQSVVYELDDGAEVRSWTETHTVKKQVLTYAGKKDNSELSIGYNPVWEDVELEMAAVIGKDGSRQEVSPEEINLLDAPWVGAAPRYPAAKILVISLPGVEVGSLIEYRYKRTKRDRPFFATRQYFRRLDPINRKSVSIVSDEATELTTIHGLPEGAFSVTQLEGGRTSRKWTLTDQGAVKSERNLPPWWSFNPKVFVSTGNWQTYAAEVRDALLRASTDQPNAAAKAADQIQGLETERQKLIALRDFVAKNIRSAGPSLPSLPLSAVTPADRTLADGYGNATDRAVLLHAMLRAAGFEPQFVVASNERNVRNLENPLFSCPDTSIFNQVLVRVKAGEDFVYLNDTDQYAALGATPYDGFLGLALATGTIETIRAAEDKRNRSEVDYVVELSENGDAVITKTRRFHGNAFTSFHRKFAEMPPEERRRYHQQAVTSIAQGAKPEGDLVTQFDVYPGVETLSVKVERFAVRDGDYLYLRVPGISGSPFALDSDTRDNPFYVARPVRRVVTAHVRLPSDMKKVSLRPPEADWSVPANAGIIRVSSARSNGSLTLTRVVELAPTVIPASGYNKLLTINRELRHPKSAILLLTTN